MTSSTALPTFAQKITRQPPGWYPDPWYPDPIGCASWLRYWDGFDWTTRTALTVVGDEAEKAAPAEPVSNEASAGSVTDEALADFVRGAAPAEPAPNDPSATDPAATHAPDSTAPHAPASILPPPLIPTHRGIPKSARWTRGALLAVFGLLVIAILLAAPDHQTTKHAHAKVSKPLSHRAPAHLSVRISSPGDGATVQTRTALIRGVVSRSRARVTVNGESAVVRGHRFALRVRLRLGYNAFDVSAAKSGLGAGSTSVSILRKRSASERAALLARREARRLAAEQRREAAAAQQSAAPAVVAPTTSYGGGGSTSASTPAGSAVDSDLAIAPRAEPQSSTPPPVATAPAPPAATPAPAESAPEQTP
jgi:hypothetical protein